MPLAITSSRLDRELRPLVGHLRRRVRHLGVEHRGLGVLRERHHARQALVEHRGEGVDVALVGRPLALDLLGRDVVERADELPGLRQALLAGALVSPKSARKAWSRPATRMFCGLMSRWIRPASCAVSSASAIGAEDPDRPAGVELARDDHVLQVRPADQPHGDEDALVAVARLVDGDDVRVVDVRLELALAPEPLAEQDVVAQVRREDLERHRPVERDLLGLVDDAHPALAEDPGDPVSAERGALLEDPAGH